MVERQHRLDLVAHLHQRVGRKAARREPVEHARLRRRRQRAHLAPAVGEEAERPRRRDRRIELAQRARRRVARIGEHLPARRLLPLVELEERRLGHVDLAAHLADLRHALAAQLIRNVGERLHVRGHVLAFAAVAAGGGADEPAAFVAQGAGEAVDLGLGGERHPLVLRQPQEAAHPLDELAHLLVGERVAEREHRHRVPHLGEFRRRLRADPARGQVRAHELGKARLDLLVAPPQRVVFGIRDGRRVLLVVAPVVLADGGREPLELGLGLRFGQLLDRGLAGVWHLAAVGHFLVPSFRSTALAAGHSITPGAAVVHPGQILASQKIAVRPATPTMSRA